MADEKKTPQDALTETIKIGNADNYIEIDPDTGDVIEETLTDEQLEQLLAAHKKSLSNIVEKYGDKSNAAVKIIAESLNAPLRDNLKKINAALNILSNAVSEDLISAMAELRDKIQPAFDIVEELHDLQPYIEAEAKKEDYTGLTYKEIIQTYTPGELLEQLEDPTSKAYQTITAARTAKKTAEHVTIQRAKNVEYPLDKISGRAWNLFTEDTGGQIAVEFDMLPKRQNLQATAYYSINFENLGNNLKITRRLLPFDKRVYIAVSALFNAGNDVITLSQIYYAMGNTGRPSGNQLDKIHDALTKMTGARITLDNKQEAEALNGQYPHFVYDGSLLPIERMTAVINGQVTDGAIHIFREPPLMTFAKERKQVTTLSVKLLQSPISKTDVNLSIDDYLIDRISKAKNGKGNSCKILFKTLYDRAGITGAKQRQRAPKKIEKYLEYYQQQDFIKRYTMSADGMTVYF